MISNYFRRVILGEERGLVSWIIRGLAWPLSSIYSTGLAGYLWLYSTGLRKRYRLPTSVISVGNLTFGGTGKTPVVEKICLALAERGISVAVLSRGYGGHHSNPLVVSDGHTIMASVEECGDEPLALARSMPGIPILVGKNRCVVGKLACEKFNPHVIVLDDGFQYWQLHRDLDIVVVDAKRPFGSGYVMPMGDLREPISGLRRASVVLLNNADPAGMAIAQLRHRISKLAPESIILTCRRRPRTLLGCDGSKIDLSWLRERRVLAFCGIGSPKSFFETIDSLGAQVCDVVTFPDHHRYTKSDFEHVEARRISCGADILITTTKDAVRIKSAGEMRNLYVLDIELEIDDERQFIDLLKRHVKATS
ncbi:MAG: tetraacyldisaccharide 4'-kinase [Armatimonadota bacterium]